MQQSFFQALIGIFVFHILADEADRRPRLTGSSCRSHHLAPSSEIARRRLQIQKRAGRLIDALLGKHQRDFVNRLDISRRDHGFYFDVAE